MEVAEDLATLRCKQHRQADAAELLEELAQKAPPTFITLGTVPRLPRCTWGSSGGWAWDGRGFVYNQLRQYEKAESWFHQAVNLKGGTPEREADLHFFCMSGCVMTSPGAFSYEDIWNLAICKKNMGRYEEALPMLQQALAEFQLHEPHHPVPSASGSCIRAARSVGYGGAHIAVKPEAEQEAYDLYSSTVGRRSPLFCGAAEGKAKALQKDRRGTQMLVE
eukprot:Skav200279  [mRNA]  locus=scaffold718:62131:64976:- [translate_table: standard]